MSTTTTAIDDGKNLAVASIVAASDALKLARARQSRWNAIAARVFAITIIAGLACIGTAFIFNNETMEIIAATIIAAAITVPTMMHLFKGASNSHEVKFMRDACIYMARIVKDDDAVQGNPEAMKVIEHIAATSR